MFSVIIPTLQRSSFLPDLLHGLARLPEVGEIIVINNADRPLDGASGLAKVRVLDQGRNIYVNPAWNLGVREAEYDLICLCSDDVLVTSAAFGLPKARIRRGAGSSAPLKCACSRRSRPDCACRRSLCQPSFDRSGLACSCASRGTPINRFPTIFSFIGATTTYFAARTGSTTS